MRVDTYLVVYLKKMKIYTGIDIKGNMLLATNLRVPALLTNANNILKTFGSDATLKEYTQIMLDESNALRVFSLAHGICCNKIVEKALDLC